VNMEEDAVNKHLVDSFVVDREKVIIIIWMVCIIWIFSISDLPNAPEGVLQHRKTS
jgi:hypothetical protein